MEKELQQFMRILALSCEGITDQYFQLPQAKGDRVYRERVYCYELYHQMRRQWSKFRYSLGGEVDKSGHPIFRDGPYRHSKPDFLVHVPGDMGENLAIVEVKASTATFAAMSADVKKLIWYCGPPANYFCGILHVYGYETKFDRAWPNLKLVSGSPRGLRIALLRHLNVGEPAMFVGSV
jgi:hypothetical protein